MNHLRVQNFNPYIVNHIAFPGRATVVIGGHTDGIKFIARHLDQYHLKSLQVIPNQPALNTVHFSQLGEDIIAFLKDTSFQEWISVIINVKNTKIIDVITNDRVDIGISQRLKNLV